MTDTAWLIPDEYDLRTRMIAHPDGDHLLLIHPEHAPLVVDAAGAVQCPLLSVGPAAVLRHEARKTSISFSNLDL